MARVMISQLILVIALLPLVAIFVQAFAAAESNQNLTISNEELRSYLKSFGYLSNATKDSDIRALKSALKLYQETYHLKVTGELDPETINLITTPRCGCPDHNLINGSSQSRIVQVGSSQVLFKLGVTKWPRKKYNLSYKIINGDPPKANISERDLSTTLRYAFQLWANVSNFRFQKVPLSSPADLMISFQTGDHVKTPDKDLWAHGVLAYANPPTDGTMHINAFVNWSYIPPQLNQTDLVWVVAHEIGHLIGIDHSLNTEAVMFAYVARGKTRRHLHPDDIAAVHAMYPPRPPPKLTS